jgi:hypothetical protein
MAGAFYRALHIQGLAVLVEQFTRKRAGRRLGRAFAMRGSLIAQVLLDLLPELAAQPRERSGDDGRNNRRKMKIRSKSRPSADDWRHLNELLGAGHEVYAGLKNLVVWVKDWSYLLENGFATLNTFA